MQVTRLEATAAPQARPEAGARASAMVHPCPRAVLHPRSTRISHRLHERGAKVSQPRRAHRHQKGQRSACVRGGWAEGVRSPLRGPPPDRRRRGCQKIRRGAAKKNRPGPTSRRPGLRLPKAPVKVKVKRARNSIFPSSSKADWACIGFDDALPRT